MRLLLIPVLLAVAAVAAGDVEEKCKEGKSWQVDCNTCTCMNGAVACTMMGCIHLEPQHRPHSPFIRRRRDDLVVNHNSYKDAGDVEEKCEEGTIWKVDCNTCTCMNGAPACTRIGCIHLEPQHLPHAGDVEEKCEEGTIWEVDCNTCTCMNGTAACTRVGCFHLKPQHLPHSPFIRRRRDDLVVKHNSYKDAGDVEEKCEEGKSWKVDCNTCTCMNGAPACTRIGCIHLEPQHLPHAPFHRRLRGDLVVKHNSYKDDCVPGDYWMDQDCNRCNCLPDKLAVCTKRKCSDGNKLTPTAT